MIVEGFFVEDVDGLIFDVKGLLHPPDRVIAYLRYFPDLGGDRERGGVKYRKVYSLAERDAILKAKKPSYLYFDPVFGMFLEGVPRNEIARIYDPREKLRNLVRGERSRLEEAAVSLALEVAKTAGIPLSALGVSGSILVDLAGAGSDVDIVVFGEKNSRKAYEALGDLMAEGRLVKAYDETGLRKLYEFRFKDTVMSYEDFVWSERRKHMSGTVMGYDFFVRFVKFPEEYGERYGERRYKPLGSALVKGVVVDDSDAIFTPCRYVLDAVEVLDGVKKPVVEIFSLRGRFSDQAREGEEVLARGKVEAVSSESGEYFRLVVGGERGDFLIVRREAT